MHITPVNYGRLVDSRPIRGMNNRIELVHILQNNQGDQTKLALKQAVNRKNTSLGIFWQRIGKDRDWVNFPFESSQKLKPGSRVSWQAMQNNRPTEQQGIVQPLSKMLEVLNIFHSSLQQGVPHSQKDPASFFGVSAIVLNSLLPERKGLTTSAIESLHLIQTDKHPFLLWGNPVMLNDNISALTLPYSVPLDNKHCFFVLSGTLTK